MFRCNPKPLRPLSTWLTLVLVLTAATALAQPSSKDLQSKEKALKKDIKTSEKILNETKKGVRANSTRVRVLSTKIQLHEDLIREYRKEVKRLDGVIEENTALVEAMEADLEQLKQEYATLVYNAYKSRHSHSRIMFVFSSENFNQAYQRLKYMQEFTAYRQRQAEQIEFTKADITRKNDELALVREEKSNLIDKEEQENQVLASERKAKSRTLKELKSKEEDLKDDIRKKKKEASALADAIKAAIERELAAARNKDIDLELSASFAKNQRKLPFPAKDGIVTGKFGTHPDPIYPSFTVQNNGIDISIPKGTKARSVFTGKVSGVFIIPGSGKVVMVRHGEYTTVYTNLKEVFVKMGDQLQTRQEIGDVITENNESKLHFEVWKGQTPQDPAKWLYKVK